MKCCICKKEINSDVHEVPPKWFGLYRLQVLVRVICVVCIVKNKEWYKDGTI